MKYLLLLLSFLLFLPAFAQNSPVRLAPPLQEVTVYFNGAALKHSGELNLPAGQSEVYIGGISAFIEAKSLQVEVSSNAELLSANLITVPAPKGAVLFTDSLTQLE